MLRLALQLLYHFFSAHLSAYKKSGSYQVRNHNHKTPISRSLSVSYTLHELTLKEQDKKRTDY
jgi:hypothetical protein